MKCTIPEIFWHNREPVLSVDIQPKPFENDPNKNIRLASAGSDQHVLVCIEGFNRFVQFACGIEQFLQKMLYFLSIEIDLVHKKPRRINPIGASI